MQHLTGLPQVPAVRRTLMCFCCLIAVPPSCAVPCCAAVCPRGSYEPSQNATRCSRCESNSYCPGGDKVENPSSRGSRMECGANLVTRNTGARTQSDCGTCCSNLRPLTCQRLNCAELPLQTGDHMLVCLALIWTSPEPGLHTGCRI